MYEDFSTLFSRKDKVRFCLLLCVLLGGAALEIISVGAVPVVVSLVIAPENVSGIVEKMTSVLTWLHLPKAGNVALWGGVILCALYLIRTFYLIASFALQERILLNRRIALSSRLFSDFMSAPYAYFMTRNSSEAVEMVSGEVDRIVSNFLGDIINLTRNVIIIAALMVFLLCHAPGATAIAFLSLGITGGAFSFFTRRKLRHIGETLHRERIEANASLMEAMGAFKEVRLLDVQGWFSARFHRETERFCEAVKVQNILSRILWPFMELITVLVILGTMSLLLLHNAPQEIAPVIALITVCLARLKGVVSESFVFVNCIRGVLPIVHFHAQRLRELESFEQPYITDGKTRPALAPLPFQEIRLERVGFQYPKQASFSLQDISLSLKAGHSLALVGATGSGKTTIANIIVGLLPPTSGQLLIDGQPLDSQERLRAWHNSIGYVAQDAVLIDDTLRANIAFGVPSSEIDEQAVQEAIQSAQLTDVIAQMPAGLDTIVGERGVRLSGGQRQRVAIARALYRKPQLLVFDEATSSLDMLTEREFTEAVGRLRGTHTILAIAHRLSTIRYCDAIAYVDGGSMAAIGTYEELQKTVPAFAEMTREG